MLWYGAVVGCCGVVVWWWWSLLLDSPVVVVVIVMSSLLFCVFVDLPELWRMGLVCCLLPHSTVE